MLGSESLNDIVEEPTVSEWGEDGLMDDEFDDDFELKSNVGLVQQNLGSRPGTTTSSVSQQQRSDSKRIRSKYTPQTILGYSAANLKRDPIIETLIDSRKSLIIDNEYTRLAQLTSQVLRPSQQNQIHPTKTPTHRPKTVNQVHFNPLDNQINSSENEPDILIKSIPQLDNDKWDDGLNSEFDKESIASKDKSSIQVYEETCKRLNICPSSMIIRSLYTTKINLENYGLGTKGSQALAVALLRNTTIVTLNLSGNNIGNSGMSHIYQILTENSYVEDYDLSYNNLGTKGIRKLAAAAVVCLHLRTLNIAGNNINGNDINMFLSKIEDHPNLKELNLSHNHLDEEGGIGVAKWMSDNNVLTHLDVSWCSIRLLGARALAKAIGDNNKLQLLNLSNNSFVNDTVDLLTDSLTRNVTLNELNLTGNEIFCRFDTKVKEDPSIILIGKDAIVYRLFVAAATNQALKIFRLGKNHIDARCILIMLEALSKLENITLEELDLTGLTLNFKQIADIHQLFANHSKFTCHIEPIHQTIEQFANNVLNQIHKYCKQNQFNLTDVFETIQDKNLPYLIVTYEQFRVGLKQAKISYPIGQFENICKYLGHDEDDNTISLESLAIA